MMRRWKYPPWRANKPAAESEELLFGADSSPHAYDEYPVLEAVPEAELRAAILRARLSADDAQIAIGRLIWRSKWSNIAAVLKMDRTAASRRLRDKIIPKIQANLKLCEQTS